MITISMGRWITYGGRFFLLRRIYWRGRWTPFCRVYKRYDSWLGYWGK